MKIIRYYAKNITIAYSMWFQNFTRTLYLQTVLGIVKQLNGSVQYLRMRNLERGAYIRFSSRD